MDGRSYRVYTLNKHKHSSGRTRIENRAHTLEARPNSSIEAHGCEFGTLTRGTLVIIGNGPNKSRHNYSATLEMSTLCATA